MPELGRGAGEVVKHRLTDWLKQQWKITSKPYPDLFVVAAGARNKDPRFLAQLASSMASLKDQDARDRVAAAGMRFLDQTEDFRERFGFTLRHWGIDLEAMRARRKAHFDSLSAQEQQYWGQS